MAGNWPIRRLADLCESVDYGYTTSAKDIPCGPKFLRITDIVSSGINWDSVPYCEIEDSALPRFLLNHGDIVIARTGATTGYSAYIANPPDAVFASYLVRMKIGPEADSRFIAYFLKSSRFWDYMRGVMGDKSAQPNASAKTITQVKLKVPSLKEQKAIAHILGTLDDKIELNRRMNETLEGMARAIFKSWFVDFDPVHAKAEGRPTGLPPEIDALFPESFQDSELGEIPKGWYSARIDDIAMVSSGKRPSSRYEHQTDDACIPLWGGNGPMAYVESPLFTTPVVLTGRVGTLGSVFRITSPCWPSDNTLVLQSNSEIGFEFLYLLLKRIDLHSLNRGSTQPLITQTDLKSQRFILPPLKLLRRFHQATDSIFRKIDHTNAENYSLSGLRNLLLPKLISGELRFTG